jgi:hypothetical protein
MNIRYNTQTGSFDVEFSTDFHGDLAAVKAAGFRYDGASRVWYTNKLAVLNKLRENKPASGLTIAEDAYQAYLRLSEIEAKNAEVRKQFAPIKEEQDKAKKIRKKKEIHDLVYIAVKIPPKPGQDFDYIGAEDLPPMPPFEKAYVPSTPPLTMCLTCYQPTYFYELPNLCLWCAISLDNTRMNKVLSI